MRAWMQQVSKLREEYGIEVIWVTSGAIAWAARQTKFSSHKRTLPHKQALSAIGQPLVMDQYNLALHHCGLLGAQVLLTADDMTDRVRKKNLQNSLEQVLKFGAIPILNENDAVATEEIQFGDNDQLAARVAIMMKAERLVLMTDVDGLFAQDPKKFPGAQLIAHLPVVDEKLLQRMKNAAQSTVGTGGIYSKLLAARQAQSKKIRTHLIRGDVPDNLIQIAEGKALGTEISRRKK